MPKYKVSFEYETVVEADDKDDALTQVVEMWDFGNINSEAIVEEESDD
jgi:cellobiose-specific phosphotransferase system component IIB